MVRSFLLLVFLHVMASGQSYDFSIPRFECTAAVNSDLSIDIEYMIEFRCTEGYHPIDIVDIGFPTEDYHLGSIRASVDDERVSRIYPSEYIDIGVEVHLGSRTIYPGRTGLFRLTGTNPAMVFLDSDDPDYASVEFTPTWFDGSLLSGESDFTLTLVFPSGAMPEDVRHHDIPFSESFIDGKGCVNYVWRETRKISEQYMVGISFPAALVDGPLTERPSPPLLSRGAVSALITIGIISIISGLLLWIIIGSVRRTRRRLVSYLPPEIGLEGSGIKRGLTAPMAALLLQERLEQVLVLILYGMLRRGSIEIRGSGKDANVVKTEASGGVRSYEKALLELLPSPGKRKKSTVDSVKKIFVDMIDKLEVLMKGFSIEETRDYYRHVMRNAWEMVRNADSAEKAGLILMERFAWLFADPDFQQKVDSLPEFETHTLPHWYGMMFMHGVSPSGQPSSLNLVQICSGIAGSLEGAAGNAVSTLSKLSAVVTTKTNPPPVRTSSSYRSSGSSSCACACACAGCACACAGGGR